MDKREADTTRANNSGHHWLVPTLVKRLAATPIPSGVDGYRIGRREVKQ